MLQKSFLLLITSSCKSRRSNLQQQSQSSLLSSNHLESTCDWAFPKRKTTIYKIDSVRTETTGNPYMPYHTESSSIWPIWPTVSLSNLQNFPGPLAFHESTISSNKPLQYLRFFETHRFWWTASLVANPKQKRNELAMLSTWCTSALQSWDCHLDSSHSECFVSYPSCCVLLLKNLRLWSFTVPYGLLLVPFLLCKMLLRLRLILICNLK